PDSSVPDWRNVNGIRNENLLAPDSCVRVRPVVSTLFCLGFPAGPGDSLMAVTSPVRFASLRVRADPAVPNSTTDPPPARISTGEPFDCPTIESEPGSRTVVDPRFWASEYSTFSPLSTNSLPCGFWVIATLPVRVAFKRNMFPPELLRILP